MVIPLVKATKNIQKATNGSITIRCRWTTQSEPLAGAIHETSEALQSATSDVTLQLTVSEEADALAYGKQKIDSAETWQHLIKKVDVFAKLVSGITEVLLPV